MFLTGAGGSKAAMDQHRGGRPVPGDVPLQPVDVGVGDPHGAPDRPRRGLRGAHRARGAAARSRCPATTVTKENVDDVQGARLLAARGGRRRPSRPGAWGRPAGSVVKVPRHAQGTQHRLLRPRLADRRPRRPAVLPRRPRASSAPRASRRTRPSATGSTRSDRARVPARDRGPAHGARHRAGRRCSPSLTTVQIYLPELRDDAPWLAAFHPVLALLVLGLAAHIGRRYIGGAAGGGSGAAGGGLRQRPERAPERDRGPRSTSRASARSARSSPRRSTAQSGEQDGRHERPGEREEQGVAPSVRPLFGALGVGCDVHGSLVDGVCSLTPSRMAFSGLRRKAGAMPVAGGTSPTVAVKQTAPVLHRRAARRRPARASRARAAA